jgi:hypothetical protein
MVAFTRSNMENRLKVIVAQSRNSNGQEYAAKTWFRTVPRCTASAMQHFSNALREMLFGSLPEIKASCEILETPQII